MPEDQDQTIVQMRESLAQKQQLANRRLQDALSRLSALLTPTERDGLDKLQVSWELYRAAKAEFARLEFDGGSNARLAGDVADVAETDRRTQEILTEIENRT